DFIDPEVFRPDSMLGVPGLVRAVLAGNVVVANGIGNGIGDDKLTYTYVPDLIRYYLAEEPILPNVDTWRLEEPESRAEVLDRLEELVVKPVDGSGGKGIVIGPAATVEELDPLAVRVSAGAPPLRSAPVRAEQRRRRLGAARRAHTGRPAPRRDDRELLPRRRVEGHLGAGCRAHRRPGPLGLGRTGAGGRGRGDRGPHRQIGRAYV